MKSNRRPSFLLASLALAAAAALGACGGADQPDIVGDWTDSATTLGKNTLTIRSSLKGTATVFYFQGSTTGEDQFSVSCDDTNPSETICDLSCSGGCPSTHNFQMTCPAVIQGSLMHCTGNGIWSGYVFDWQRAN